MSAITPNCTVCGPPRRPRRGRLSVPGEGIPRRSGPRRGLSARIAVMKVESRDSVSLKPAELDELGQFVAGLGLPISDAQMDRQIEQFPLIAVATDEAALLG